MEEKREIWPGVPLILAEPSSLQAPFLYDDVLTHILEWPSLTVQWLPKYQRSAHQLHDRASLTARSHFPFLLLYVSYCMPVVCRNVPLSGLLTNGS